MSHSVFALISVGIDAHEQAVAQTAPYVALDGAVHLFHLAPHQRHILPLGGLVEKLQSQRGFGAGRLGHHEQTRGVLVDAVHQTHARVGHIIVGVIFEMPCESVDQRAVVVAVARVHTHAGRLVHHKQFGVFVNDVQRDVLRHDFVLIARAVHHHADDVTRMHAVVRFHGGAVHADALRLGGVLNAVARRSLDALDQIFVDAQQHLTLLYFIAIVFPVIPPALIGKVGVTEV